MADGAVSVEDGGAVADAGHSGQQGEGGEEAEGVAHHQVPAGNFSGEGRSWTVTFCCLGSHENNRNQALRLVNGII